MNGKRKGGIKVHTLMDAGSDVAIQISFTAASTNDMTFLKEIDLDAGSLAPEHTVKKLNLKAD